VKNWRADRLSAVFDQKDSGVVEGRYGNQEESSRDWVIAR
jgi:hypothetical protein